MTIFDKIGEGVKNFTEKASDVVEASKISAKINAEKNVITALKTQMGELLMSQYLEDKITDQDLLELCQKVTESQEIINKYEEDIVKIKKESPKEAKKHVCKYCGAEIKENAKFCLGCGSKLDECDEEPCEEVNAREYKQCPSCNEKLDKESKFCPNCGYHFEGKEIL